MAGAQFTIPLITVIPGQLIASSLWNNEFTNIANNLNPLGLDGYEDTDTQMQIQTAPYSGSVTSHATSLGGEIERIRYQISQILGATTPAYWYAAPPTNLVALAALQIPIGGIVDFPVATPPNANWLLANGQAIGRVAYATLYTLIGTTYGIGDGSNTFNIPNYTDRVGSGAGNLYAAAAIGGQVSQTLTDPGHNHSQNPHSHVLANTIGSIGTPDTNCIPPASTNSTTATNNASTTGITPLVIPTLPPYVGIYKMIRVL